MIFSNKQITKALIRLRGSAAGLRLCCSQTLKTGFLVLRPICGLADEINGIFSE